MCQMLYRQSPAQRDVICFCPLGSTFPIPGGSVLSGNGTAEILFLNLHVKNPFTSSGAGPRGCHGTLSQMLFHQVTLRRLSSWSGPCVCGSALLITAACVFPVIKRMTNRAVLAA